METNKNRLRVGTAVRVRINGHHYCGVITHAYNNKEYYNVRTDNDTVLIAHLNQLSPIIQFSWQEGSTLSET